MTTSLEDLRTFTAVYETGGFSAAARRLSLTTNAVSLRIRRLEQHLGLHLFVRTTRVVSPTEEARIYYARIVRVLSDLEHAEEALQRDSRSLSGAVRIAILGVLAARPFLKRLRVLLDANPSLNVDLLVTNATIDVVSAGLDIAVVAGRPADSSLVGRLLGSATWVLAATPGYLDAHGRPESPEALSSHRCLRLLTTPSQNQWTLVDVQGRRTTVAVGEGFTADDSRTLGDAVYAGLGIGLRPAGECARAQAEGRLERVLPGMRFQTVDIYAVMPAARSKMPRVVACADLLHQALSEIA